MTVQKSPRTKSRRKNPAALLHRMQVGLALWSVLLPASYIFAVIILFQFACVQIAIALNEPQVTSVAITQPAPAALNAIAAPKIPVPTGMPTQITFPTLHVNAKVLPVGLTKKGAMDAPKLPKDAVWYKLGARPGEIGSAVLAWHVNWKNGAIGAFAQIKKLKAGDTFTIKDDQGKNLTFIVRKSQLLGEHDDATSIFRSTDGKAHVNLITCAGTWNNKTKSYSKRLVVFADKVEE